MAHDVAALAVELTDMAAADHRSSIRANSDDPAEQLAWRRLTARHGDRLGEIMDEYGWPTADLVGEEAARAAWLIAQHADRQLDIQRRALRLMEQGRGPVPTAERGQRLCKVSIALGTEASGLVEAVQGLDVGAGHAGPDAHGRHSSR